MDEDDSICAVGFKFGIIYIYKVDSGSCFAKLRGHDGDIQSFIFIQEKLISAGKDRNIKIWNISQNKCLQTRVYEVV